MPASIDDSTRRNRNSRCVETHAAAADVSASAMVSQPLSRAKVSASASAASVPVAVERGCGGRVSWTRVATASGFRWRPQELAASGAARVETGSSGRDGRCGHTARSTTPAAQIRLRPTRSPAPMRLSCGLVRKSLRRQSRQQKAAAVTRCNEMELSVGEGPMPGSGPPGNTSMSGLARTAHSRNTRPAKAAANATAPVAAGARHATNSVAAVSTANTMMAASA